MKPLFRKTALDRLSSPEQIDQLLAITPLRAWIALGAVAGILLLALLWGIFGSIATYVTAKGIFVREGGAYEIVSYGEGRLLSMEVNDGDIVEKGQLVAKVELPELAVKLENARVRVAELQHEDELASASEKTNVDLSIAAMDEQKITLTNAAADFDRQVDALSEQVTIQEDLQKRGLIPKATLLNTQTALASAKQSASNARVDLATNTSRRSELISSQREKSALRRIQITAAQHEYDEIKKLYDESTEVRSPYHGRILDVVVEEGNFLNRNDPVMTLEVFDQPLVVIIFIPAGDGKRTKPGMPAQVSPSSAKREEYGFIESKLRTVSDFPVTDEAAQKFLHNARLTEQLTGKGSVVIAEVTLDSDPSTPSGFRWSSSQGPDTEISSGTICECRIVVREQRPITLVLPYLKKLLGVE